MTLYITRSMMDFAASLGADWARVLLQALKDTTLIDMGAVRSEVPARAVQPVRPRVQHRQERLL